MDKEGIKHKSDIVWLGSVHWVLFSALTLLEVHPACKVLHQLIRKSSLSEQMEELGRKLRAQLANPGSLVQ